MDKLINVQIKGNKLIFTVDIDMDLSQYENMEVYIDEACNLKNILNDVPEHNNVITEAITIEDKEVTVVNEEILLLDWNIKYITFRCYTEDEEVRFNGIYYNPEIIYTAEIRKLQCKCSTCLDDETMQNLMLIVFKRQLLEYAIQAGHFKDAIVLYIDICRLLEISLKGTSNNCSNGNCCKSCILTQDAKCLRTETNRCLRLESDRTTSNCSNGLCRI